MQENSKTAYSERKIKAKLAPEYSVLKPETNSDSDSLKSKGARWVSAKVQINHRGKKKINKNLPWTLNLRIEYLKPKRRTKTNKVPNTDS